MAAQVKVPLYFVTGIVLVKRILIADDHESVLRRIRAMLESQPGWEVCGDAVTGRETITRALELKPDLIVIDFAMPQMDGLHAASAIRTLLPRVPIVMFTMYSSAVSQEAGNHGINRLIDKAESALLIPAVQELLDALPSPPSAEQKLA
jgi:two-component system, NarL family, response regulator NreC